MGLNPGRDGVIEVLRAMGAAVEVAEREPAGGVEPVGDVEVRGGPLHGTRIGGALVPRLIDELPVIAVLATQAEGVTEIRDAAELRAKESDRIAHLAEGLRRMGARLRDAPRRAGHRGADPADPGRGRRRRRPPPGHGLRGGGVPRRGTGVRPTSPARSSVAISYPDFFEDLATHSPPGSRRGLPAARLPETAAS